MWRVGSSLRWRGPPRRPRGGQPTGDCDPSPCHPQAIPAPCPPSSPLTALRSNAGKLSRRGIITVDVVVVRATRDLCNPAPRYAALSHLLVLLVTNSGDGGPVAHPEDCFVPFKGTFERSDDAVAAEGTSASPAHATVHAPLSACVRCVSCMRVSVCVCVCVRGA